MDLTSHLPDVYKEFVYFRFFVHFLISCSWKYLQLIMKKKISTCMNTNVSWKQLLSKHRKVCDCFQAWLFQSWQKAKQHCFTFIHSWNVFWVLTRYQLLCSSVCSASTSAQSLIHPTDESNHMFSTALNQGMASIVLAACLTILELFGQNRVLTSITGNICLLSFDSEGNIFATKR